jgi:hypothetical protein
MEHHRVWVHTAEIAVDSARNPLLPLQTNPHQSLQQEGLERPIFDHLIEKSSMLMHCFLSWSTSVKRAQ